MVVLVACLVVALVLLAIVLLARFRPSALAPIARPFVAAWRSRGAVTYGRHSHANTPASGLRMRDGDDRTRPIRLPRQYR